MGNERTEMGGWMRGGEWGEGGMDQIYRWREKEYREEGKDAWREVKKEG